MPKKREKGTWNQWDVKCTNEMTLNYGITFSKNDLYVRWVLTVVSFSFVGNWKSIHFFSNSIATKKLINDNCIDFYFGCGVVLWW